MERNKEDFVRRRKSQDSSRAPDTASESFGKVRRPLAIDVRRRPMHGVMWWSLGSVGVIGIAILVWLAGSTGSRLDVSMSALETIKTTETILFADLQASVSASESLRENLVVATGLVAKLEARLTKMDTLLDSATVPARSAASDSDETISSQQEHSASAKPEKDGRENPVAAVQSRLMDLGYDPGPVDGSWGENTCKALKAYQRDKRAPMGCGAENRSVAELQSRLIDLGYDPGAIDGSWGKKTCKALQAYQRDNGLRVSCREHNRTVAALNIR